MKYLDLLNEPRFRKLKKEMNKIPGWKEFNFIEKEIILEIIAKALKENKVNLYDEQRSIQTLQCERKNAENESKRKVQKLRTTKRKNKTTLPAVR